MNVQLEELLSVLATKGVTITLSGEELVVRAPKNALTPELREALGRAKAELKAFLSRAPTKPVVAPIVKDTTRGTGPIPLSSGQRRFLVLHQITAGKPLYNIQTGFRIAGQLDVPALQKAYALLLQRHPAMRTTFPEANGTVSAVVNESADQPPIEIIDLSREARERREAALHALAIQRSHCTFDLAEGPLTRACLVLLSSNEHALFITQHHIVTDAWALAIMVKELVATYEALARGHAPVFDPLPIQYADYARWQEERASSPEYRQLVHGWVESLRGVPRIEIPTDHVLTGDPTYAGGAHEVVFDSELTSGLRALAAREGCTLFVTLVALLTTLLHRYSRQVDFGISTVVAGRDRPELSNVIGFFVNTLMLRCDVSGTPTFRTLLQRARATVERALEEQDAQFDDVVQALGAPRGPSLNPLIQVHLLLESEKKPLVAGSTTWTTYGHRPGATIEGTSKFDLGVMVGEKDGLLWVLLEYSKDLFEHHTIERMGGHLETLARSAVATPEAPVAKLAMLTQAERQLALSTWNDTERDFPREACLHDLFEQQAAHHPEAIAVEFLSERITYQALDVRAGQLAAVLRQAGVRPETLVGVFVERSIEMVVGLLAVLKAGGAYVPLDPTLPKSRIAFVIEKAGVGIVLTTRRLESLISGSHARVIHLDSELSSAPATLASYASEVPTASNLAYVIYTSGSTGEPKGVAIEHRSAVNTIVDVNDRFAVTAKDRIFGISSFGFDLSVYDIFGALAAGATVVIPESAATRDPAEWAALVEQHRVTIWNSVPQMMEMLVEHASLTGPDPLRTLRLVMLSGDWIPVTLPDRLRALLPAVRIISLGGATEGAIWSIFYPIEEVAASWRSIPYGRPMFNQRFYVLDEALEPCPVNVTGELYIGGVGVARCYFRDDERTRASFVTLPHTGERIYRTGDLGRYGADGVIEFLGRVDSQVKIRGHRIELGEIEATLCKAPGILEAVVVARNDATRGQHLVAYARIDPIERSDAQYGSVEDLMLTRWSVATDAMLAAWPEPEDPTLNTAGWLDSASGTPLGADVMREWVNHTADRVVSLDPRRVLDLRCGTGMLALRIAPRCERYVACDGSKAALAWLGEQAAANGITSLQTLRAEPHVALSEAQGPFDTVVFSAPTKNLPSLDYLRRLIDAATGVVGPRGKIVIADVQSLALHESFATFVTLGTEPDDSTGERIYGAAVRRMEMEEDLLIDPAVFEELRFRCPEVTAVSMNVKRGRMDSELTRYHYDVVLWVGAIPPLAGSVQWVDAHGERVDLTRLRETLADSAPEALVVRNIRNARLSPDVRVIDLLHKPTPVSADDLRRAAEEERGRGTDPEEIWRLGDDLSYDVEVRWVSRRQDGAVDAIFRRRHPASANPPVAIGQHEADVAPSTSRRLAHPATQPYFKRLRRAVVSEARALIAARLPEYMSPAAIVPVESFPLSENGKLDRSRLPPPQPAHFDRDGSYVAPRTPAEIKMCALWADVLDRDRFGTTDNFFEHGGSSLKAMELAARLSAALSKRVPVRVIMAHPTVEGMLGWADGVAGAPPKG